MKIITRQGILRTELFKEIVYHEKVCCISFCYAYRYEEDGEQATEFQVPPGKEHIAGVRQLPRVQMPLA